MLLPGSQSSTGLDPEVCVTSPARNELDEPLSELKLNTQVQGMLKAEPDLSIKAITYGLGQWFVHAQHEEKVTHKSDHVPLGTQRRHFVHMCTTAAAGRPGVFNLQELRRIFQGRERAS